MLVYRGSESPFQPMRRPHRSLRRRTPALDAGQRSTARPRTYRRRLREFRPIFQFSGNPLFRTPSGSPNCHRFSITQPVRSNRWTDESALSSSRGPAAKTPGNPGQIRPKSHARERTSNVRQGGEHVVSQHQFGHQSLPDLRSELVQPAAVDFQTSGQCVESGNLSAAQTAFHSLQQTVPKPDRAVDRPHSQVRPIPSAATFRASPTRCNSGNLDSAQQAFAQLQKDMQSQQTSGHHHHHHGGGGAAKGQAVQSLISSLSSSSSSSSSTSSTGNKLNVTA